MVQNDKLQIVVCLTLLLATLMFTCCASSFRIEKVLRYEDDDVSLLFDPECSGILGWITTNSGEKKVLSLIRNLTKQHCTQTTLFLDIGANCGMYGLYASSMGCRTLLFDAQPGCHRLIRSNIHMNHQVSGLASLIPRPVSDKHMVLTVPKSTGCSGAFSVSVGNKIGHGGNVSIPSISVPDAIGRHPVFLAKIDTEGHELQVLRSMRPLAEQRLVLNIIVEVTPLFWKRDLVDRKDVFEEIALYERQGCTIVRVLELGEASPAVPFSISGLHEYLVHGDFVQEDLWIRC